MSSALSTVQLVTRCLPLRASHAPGDRLRYRFHAAGRGHAAPSWAIAPCLAIAGTAPRLRRCLGRQKVSLMAVRKLSGTRLSRKRLADVTNSMPPMSKDGGSEEEFEEYWHWFKEPQCFGSWIERRTHPQVSVLPYWYNIDTQETIFDAPERHMEAKVLPSLEPLKLEGLIGELSVKELRAKLQEPEELRRLNLTDTMLARRAVWEYETFIPRVLSWHDYQYNTFWFFIEERDSKSNYGRRDKGGYFGPQSDEAKKLFAHDSFFAEVAALASQRFQQIHPINLVYLLWTFTRAGVSAQKFFNDAADHFCDGLLPSLDRCGLCTLVWCYSRQRIRHDRLFQRAAQELERTIRVRSLAPRNFQNTMIAYRWYGKGGDTEAMVQQLALWLPRLLDDHDERRPKLRKDVMFSYTCRDGSEVPADAFRINGLNVIARGFVYLDISTPEVEACLESMTNYVIRSAGRSPVWMRQDGDVCIFATIVAEAVVKGWTKAPKLLERLEAQPSLRQGARPRELDQLEAAIERAKM